MLNIFKNYYVMKSLELIHDDLKDFNIYNGIPYFNFNQFLKFENFKN
jgi:hypothetical protein